MRTNPLLEPAFIRKVAAALGSFNPGPTSGGIPGVFNTGFNRHTYTPKRYTPSVNRITPGAGYTYQPGPVLTGNTGGWAGDGGRVLGTYRSNVGYTAPETERWLKQQGYVFDAGTKSWTNPNRQVRGYMSIQRPGEAAVTAGDPNASGRRPGQNPEGYVPQGFSMPSGYVGSAPLRSTGAGTHAASTARRIGMANPVPTARWGKNWPDGGSGPAYTVPVSSAAQQDLASGRRLSADTRTELSGSVAQAERLARRQQAIDADRASRGLGPGMRESDYSFRGYGGTSVIPYQADREAYARYQGALDRLYPEFKNELKYQQEANANQQARRNERNQVQDRASAGDYAGRGDVEVGAPDRSVDPVTQAIRDEVAQNRQTEAENLQRDKNLNARWSELSPEERQRIIQERLAAHKQRGDKTAAAVKVPGAPSVPSTPPSPVAPQQAGATKKDPEYYYVNQLKQRLLQRQAPGAPR